MQTPTEPKPSYTALVVDDNWFNRDIFRIALESAGYEVQEVGDGSESIQTLDQRTFNLMVLDLQMPKVDGVTVLRKIRAAGAHPNMHIIVVTAQAHMTTGDVTNLADYVMYKPINVAEFADFVRRLKALSIPHC